MRFLFLAFLLFLCGVASAAAVPPSPAGGGCFEIYAPGDYAFVADHDDFDSKRLLKNGFTIEMWFYVSRPMEELNTATGQPFDKWVMLYKADNYQLSLHPTGTPFSEAPLAPGETPAINQWHYVAIILEKDISSESSTPCYKRAKVVFCRLKTPILPSASVAALLPCLVPSLVRS